MLLLTPMRDAEYYRAQSKFCAELAEAVKRPDYQDQWLRLAQQWRERAEQADKRQFWVQGATPRHGASMVTACGLCLMFRETADIAVIATQPIATILPDCHPTFNCRA